jgi:hypothetical protein
MKPLKGQLGLALLAVLCAGCHHKVPPAPQQAQAPPLQSGAGTLAQPKDPQPQDKAASPLASPLPPPSAQSVPLPPPPQKKVRHRTKTPKPAETASASQTPAQANVSGQPSSPIGQLTTGDTAAGERTKHETADLISTTLQGLNGIKRPLSSDEKVTAAQIHTFLKQAQQALDTGDADGGHTLATKAKLLLDELTKP